MKTKRETARSDCRNDRQEEEEEGRGQEIEVPLSGEEVETFLQVSEFHAPDEAAEVEDIVEDRSRCSGLGGRPCRRAGEAIPERGGEDDGEDSQDDYITELLRPSGDSPAKSSNERQDTCVEEKVELKPKGEGFSARETGQMSVLLSRYCTLLLPELQASEDSHSAFILRTWSNMSVVSMRFRYYMPAHNGPSSYSKVGF